MIEYLTLHWDKVLLAVVAVWGAGLSTFTALQNRKRGRREIEVSMFFGFAARGPDLGEQMIFVRAGNVGDKRTRIQGLGLQLPGKVSIHLMARPDFDQLPKDLDEGTSCDNVVEVKAFQRVARERGFSDSVVVRPYAIDGLGKQIVGKKQRIKTKG